MKQLNSPFIEHSWAARPWLSYKYLLQMTGMHRTTLSRHLKKLESHNKIVKLEPEPDSPDELRYKVTRTRKNRNNRSYWCPHPKVWTFYHVYPKDGVKHPKRFYRLLKRRRDMGQIIGTRTDDSSKFQISRQPDFHSTGLHDNLDRLSLESESQLLADRALP